MTTATTEPLTSAHYTLTEPAPEVIRCHGWTQRTDRKRPSHRCCLRGMVIEEGKRYCRRHAPSQLPRRLASLLAHGYVGAARELAERYGRTLDRVAPNWRSKVPSVETEPERIAFVVTPRQVEILEAAATVGAATMGTLERRVVAAALAQLRRHVEARPGGSPP